MSIHYIDQGRKDALPVIFLHGFPLNLEMWNEQMKVVSEQYRAIAYDIRGHGQSDVEDGQYTIESHVDDLIALLDQLNIKKVVIVGFSMGGYIALRALERNPERFRGAVLSNTKSEADTDMNKLNRFKAMKSVKENGIEAFADGFLKMAFAPETFKTNPEIVENIRKVIKMTPSRSIMGTLLALAARTDTTSVLIKIKVPTLILVGEKDEITSPKDAKSMHEKIERSELHIIPNAAHMSNLENPFVYNEKLLNFLRRLLEIQQ
ncbi:MAG: alpha/beta fold hydrolase [Bdellovibrionales bacterium]|nr:alpha/beta fold hydrolase [Bdellovibrionales bacterium]